MPDLKLISEYARRVTKCGKVVPAPAGSTFVDIPHGFLYQVTTPDQQSVTGNRPIDGDTIFIVRSIPMVMDSLTLGRIQWPGGKFLSNSLMPLSMVLGVGSFRRALTRDTVVCEPGSNIRITTSTIGVTGPTNVSMLFEGVYRYALEGGQAAAIQSAADLPRYWCNPNGNIFAPEMDLDMVLREVPDGYRWTDYRLVSNPITIAAGASVTIQIPISTAYDYLLRRLVFDPLPAFLLVRPRDGSGYELFTDYAPVFSISNAPYAQNWCLKAGTSLFIDCINPVFAGPASFTVTAVGMQQRRAQ